ncbi:hypothetical protein BKA61DRAFT_683701 [Leptodontidium sp. MPI-SDFR-AT-0119]|nr:hypothetical protein BKA61DRAFT_683701 [Leptodontidium sp. MPI-SDFR-AT-0119]
MEDQVLSSMCKGPVSYYTLAEQREDSTRHKISQREISRRGNTYICMVVPVHCRHWVAVRVTISPFSLEKFPGQIFFSSQLHYGPCCCDIDHKNTSDIVKNTVQRVIDSSYRSVCWNYSSSHDCTLDHPTNSDIEQCIAVAKSRFKAYTESHIEAHFPAAQLNSIDNQNALDGRSCSANDQLVPPASHKRTITAEPSGELIRLPPPKKQRIDKTDALVAQLVESTTVWLKDGLENLSKKTLPTLPTLSILSPSDLKDKASSLADQLWKLAEDIENAAASVVWSMRYTAACSSLLGAFSVKKGHRQNIHNWRGLVHIVNSIVNLMLPTWKDKAYLLYHVFAVKGNILSSVARLSEEKRQKFASGIANALDRLTFPSEIEGVPLFNPARVLSGMIHNISYEEICNAIWLPLAMDSDTIEAERSTFLLPNMATLSHRVKDLSALPAQVGSGNISSTLSLSPPPTPSTFQQAYSTGTGENMERCNTDKINQSSTTTNVGANLAQVGDLPPSYRNDVEATFDEFGKSRMTETPEAVTPDDAPTPNAMRPVENTGIDAWSTDHLRHSFHLPSMPPRPEGSSEAQPVTINFNSAERLQALSASGSGQGVADSMDKNMLDSLGRACYLPHALESDPSLERTINPNLLSMDTNMLSSLDNARFLSDALDAGMLSTLDKACFLSDALESDLNAERSQPQFHHAEDENMVWDQNDTNTDLGIVV